MDLYLCKWNLAAGIFRSYTKVSKVITPADGLPETIFFRWLQIKKEIFGLQHLKGASKLSAEGRLLKNYDQNSGLPTDFYSPFTVTNDGELMTGVPMDLSGLSLDNLVYRSRSHFY